VLNLVRARGATPFSNVDLEIINVLASQASISIENARLYHNIRDNYLKTVRGFALAVEAKDRYTHGHSENVMKYTVVLARELGLKAQEIEQIKYAGLLHDVGKIGVKETILNKPGRLTPEEFDEIKRHPELGARIISDVPFLKSLSPLVRHHHEWFAGGGYPDGIAHDQIPYGARILSVADAFEAMTSDRPYRKSMPLERAMEIMEKEKGSQFDPSIVDVFLKIIDQGAHRS
jgi:putative nucleotidyltransferase with HDIG domain